MKYLNLFIACTLGVLVMFGLACNNHTLVKQNYWLYTTLTLELSGLTFFVIGVIKENRRKTRRYGYE